MRSGARPSSRSRSPARRRRRRTAFTRNWSPAGCAEGARMRRRLFNWQGQRFVYLGLEGEPGRPLPRQSAELFARAGAELAMLGLSLLRNTVRTRIFGRSSAARTAGSQARAQALVGRSRAAGSSYVSPPHFASAAAV